MKGVAVGRLETLADRAALKVTAQACAELALGTSAHKASTSDCSG